MRLVMVLSPGELAVLVDAVEMALATARDERRTLLYGVLMRLRAMEPIAGCRNVY
jgi:hypothetical protein